jgi:hypothetical protein
VLASRRLLFTAIDLPRLDPGPGRKRGPGFKTRGGDGSRWSPVEMPSSGLTVRTCLVARLLCEVEPGQPLPILLFMRSSEILVSPFV